MYFIEKGKGLLPIKLQCEKCGVVDNFSTRWVNYVDNEGCELKKPIKCQNPLCGFQSNDLVCKKPPNDSLQQVEMSIGQQTKLKIELEKYEKEKANNAYTPKCPTCNSPNIRKISTANKVGSVAFFGLFAAGHVSKTFQCDSCGMKF